MARGRSGETWSGHRSRREQVLDGDGQSDGRPVGQKDFHRAGVVGTGGEYTDALSPTVRPSDCPTEVRVVEPRGQRQGQARALHPARRPGTRRVAGQAAARRVERQYCHRLRDARRRGGDRRDRVCACERQSRAAGGAPGLRGGRGILPSPPGGPRRGPPPPGPPPPPPPAPPGRPPTTPTPPPPRPPTH